MAKKLPYPWCPRCCRRRLQTPELQRTFDPPDLECPWCGYETNFHWVTPALRRRTQKQAIELAVKRLQDQITELNRIETKG